MRMIKFLFVALLPLFILAACHQSDALNTQVDKDSLTTESSSNDLPKESLNVEYHYTISGETPDEFTSLIVDNPIDLRRDEFNKNYDGSSRMIRWISFNYEKFWNREMKVAYNSLLGLLDAEDQQYLIDSQKSWESYMENKEHIEESFFFDQKYNDFGTLRGALSMDERADETKARAYSLLEYLYTITGEIKLVFSADEWQSPE